MFIVDCSGIHRGLGTHVTKIRSLTLDTASLTPEMTVLIMSIGNATSNRIWEKNMSATDKIQPNASREARARFITAKYAEKAFVSSVSSPDQSSKLLNAVSNIQFASVLKLIAEGGRLATTPALHSALGYLNSPPIQKDGRFVMAELCLQNGASLSTLEQCTITQPFGQTKVIECSVLHCAAAYQDVEAITYLLEKGADPQILVMAFKLTD